MINPLFPAYPGWRGQDSNGKYRKAADRFTSGHKPLRLTTAIVLAFQWFTNQLLSRSNNIHGQLKFKITLFKRKKSYRVSLRSWSPKINCSISSNSSVQLFQTENNTFSYLLAELPICVCPISHFFKCLKSKFVSKNYRICLSWQGYPIIPLFVIINFPHSNGCSMNIIHFNSYTPTHHICWWCIPQSYSHDIPSLF